MITQPASEGIELAGDWPPHLPSGDFTCSWRDGELWIDHADPRIVISTEVIDQVARGDVAPHAALTMVNYTIPNGHAGALLKIQAANRQVVYRLTEYVPSIRAYVGEWPE